MGNSNDKFAPLPWPERHACGKTPFTTHRLSERAAWDVAVLWHSQLHGYVTLTSDWPHQSEHSAMTPFHRASTNYTVVQRLEWIEFNFVEARPRDLKHLVRVARAATITWFALSCCPGFGADENPLFWKRVFSVYLRSSPEHSSTVYGEVTDRERFFYHPHHPFPRIRFYGCSSSLPLEQWWKEAKNEFQEQMGYQVLRTLEPFIHRPKWKRVIPVSIRVGQHGINPVKLAQRFLNQPPSKNPKAPQFHLDHVVYRRYNDKFDLVNDPRICLKVSINMSSCEPHGDQEIERLLTDQCNSPASCQLASIQTLDLCCQRYCWRPRHDVLSAMFASWCSVLPHTTNVLSVRVVENTWLGPLDDMKGAWLGYAIFHPDTRRHEASIKCLTLNVTVSHLSVVRSLRAMASGNRLVIGQGRGAESAPYTKARVRSGTIVFSTDDRDATQLYTFVSECWITICKITPSQPFYGTWACVVLPGHGIGWVLAESILELQEFPPAPSCVRRLRLIFSVHDGNDVHVNNAKMVLLEVLSALGEGLTYLHLESYGSLDTETVQSILRQCPNLTSLRIQHDGSCWTTPHLASTPEYPRLQALELSISESLVPLDAPQLDDLRDFRVLCLNADKFDANRSCLQAILRRYPRMQYMNWDLSLRSWRESPPHGQTFDSCYNHARDLLDPSELGTFDTFVLKTSLVTRLAFLSVVRRSSPMDAIGQVPSDVTQLIFEFASHAIPRLLHICDALPSANR